MLTKQYASITPQAIAIWCRQLGHSVHYTTYYGQADPRSLLLPNDLDVLSVSAYTRSSGLAYALGKLFGQTGALTVIGGPHAKSYSADCARYFDIVVKERDRNPVQHTREGASVARPLSANHYTQASPMSTPAATTRMAYAEYVAAEAVAEVRHEFLNGVAWAMSGGTPEHGALAAALIRRIGNAIDGQPCRVFTSDVRVRVIDTGLSTYPDVTVVCGKVETAPDDPEAVTNPIVLVEVLSDSTEAYDRGAKFAHYRRIPSLQAYVLVSQAEPRIELYRRTDAGQWLLSEARGGETIEIAPLSVTLDVNAVYANPLGS